MTNKIEDFIKLADAVPAQDLARALLEAEEALKNGKHYTELHIVKNEFLGIDNTYHDRALNKINKTLATIQKIKDGKDE